MPMPPIIYGTAWKKERTEALVSQALRVGFRGIDTACQPKHYHEPGVGTAIAAWLRGGFRRDELYVQTKFTALSGQDPKRIPYDADIREFCTAHGLAYQSFWTLTANPHLLADETIRLLSLKYQRSSAQILFRYLTQAGVTPLTGTTSEAHMREDLSLFEFELTATEVEAVTMLL